MKNTKTRKITLIPHTVAGKNACLMLLCSLVMLIFVLFLPSLFYNLTKGQLTDQVGNSIRESVVRIGFLLTNHRPAGRLVGDASYMALIEEYYQEGADQQELRTKIEKWLMPYEEGKMWWDRGSIGNTSYYFIVTDRGELFCQSEVLALAEAVVCSDWFQKENPSEEQMRSPYSPVMNIVLNGEENQYFCFKREFSAGDITGSIIHIALFQDYVKQLEQMKYAGIEDFLVVCGTEILYQNLSDSSLNCGSLSDYRVGDQQYEVVKEERDGGFVFTALCSLNIEGLYLIVNMTREEIMAPFQIFFRIMQICVIIIILIMVLLSCGIVFFSLRRLTRLSREMALIGNGATEITLQDNHGDEVGDIVRTTHMMLRQIQQNTEERIQHEKEEKRMQYTVMISALDPHFIYNTLDTVSFLAAMGKTEDVVKMNDALIATLKDRLQMKTYKTFDTVQMEMQVIKSYMVIQSYLCSDKITCEFQVDEDTKQLFIPKNILQPLVENSIKHGLMTNKDESGLKILEGKVIIGIHKREEKLEIIVTDNGIGMPEEMKERYLKDTFQKEGSAEHIGILNMKGRLAYLYHEDYSFDIESALGQGTTIRMIVPVSPDCLHTFHEKD